MSQATTPAGEPSGPAPTVFVVGCPRSGTTLVGELIARHSQVFNAEETMLLRVLQRCEVLRAAPAAPLAERFLDEATLLVRRLLDEARRQAGTACVVDHSPWHALCLDKAFEVFPEATAVQVIRNPWDVVASLHRSYEAGYRWAGATDRRRTRLWLEFVHAAEARAHDRRVHRVRYEDIWSDPRRAAQQLMTRLGLPWEEEVLKAYARLHAGSTSRRQPVGRLDGDGRVRFRPPEPFPGRYHPGVTRWVEADDPGVLRRHGYETMIR